jgi:hypothetical protein
MSIFPVMETDAEVHAGAGKTDTGLKKIRTARSLRSINSGVRQGFRPLLRKVLPSPDIHDHFVLKRNKRTGEIVSHTTLSDEIYDSPSWELALQGDWYPYHFKSPYAAYLIPKDIQAGEQVVLLDLIEDYAGLVYEDGTVSRMASCMAIWTGSDLDIQYDTVV